MPPINKKPEKSTASSLTNGKRKLESWIDQFVAYTDNLESPLLFRKWAGIFTIAAAMEMKCWMLSANKHMYPNLYVFIVARPGIGKTRIARESKRFLTEIPEFHFAPVSVTAAALLDKIMASKRFVAQLPDPPLEYYNTTIIAEELGAFMHKYDDEMVGVLSHFYDPDPFEQERRHQPNNKIKIPKGQINMLCATTPSSLLTMMPEYVWEQGLMSRVIMVTSDESSIGDDFAEKVMRPNAELIHDMKMIGALNGQFEITGEFRDAVNNWRANDEQLPGLPAPAHPKLLHYRTRRRVHLYKLSMVAAADRSDVLLLTKADFNRAMGWLVEAESHMPDIFTAGSTGTDARALDEIMHYVQLADKGDGVPEHKIVQFARTRIPIHSIERVVNILVASGQIKSRGEPDKWGYRWFRAVKDALG